MRFAAPIMLAAMAGCGSCSCGGGDSAVDAALVPCGEVETHSGDGTYYDADGSGNCGFDPSPGDLMVAALNTADYAGAAACGQCIAVDGPDGSVSVRVVDRCPGCAPGDVDLSREAFARIAPLSAGRAAITWRPVPCPVSGPVRYRFKEGSNPYWVAIQVRNHRHAVSTLEARAGDGTWRPLARELYNYFVEPAGLGPGPLALRVTDVHGLTVEDEGLALGDATEVAGAAQLAECR